MDRKPLSPSEEAFLSFRPEPGREPDIPPPPYQVGDVHMMFIGVRFAIGVARQLLPPELEPSGNDAGLFCIYSVESGWGVAPYSSCYAAVEVKDFNAPDGSSGYCIVTGYYSGGGFRFMRRHYNLFAVEGESRWSRQGDLCVGTGGPYGIDAVTMCIRPARERPPVASVVHHYLGQRPQGGASLFAIAWSGIWHDAEPVSLEIDDAANERMQLARPVELTYALELTDSSLTFGIPQAAGGAVDLAAAGTQVTVLDAFSHIGRAAIVVSAAGEISAMTPQAQALLGDGLAATGGRLRTAHRGDQPALDRLAETAAVGGEPARELTPIAVRRNTGNPLIVEAVSLGSAATGRPSALLLLNDPARPTASNPGPALQLLGLTPAEARIAELVGSGLSPREAGERLENAEGTVRTSLTRIYQKLDINRQSELARIVARL